jgi:type IV pilus assembly protein PilC
VGAGSVRASAAAMRSSVTTIRPRTPTSTIAAPMAKTPAAFPAMVVQMVSVGEETGALETMLNKVADFYEDQVAAAIKALTSLLEPVMIILVGAIVGFIVISMYMPLFKVYDNIK